MISINEISKPIKIWFMVLASVVAIAGAAVLFAWGLAGYKSYKTANHIEQIAGRINGYLSPEKLKYFDEAIDYQMKSTEAATNGAGAVTEATRATLEEVVQPEIRRAGNTVEKVGKSAVSLLDALAQTTNENNARIAAQLEALTALTLELERQVKQNGDASKDLIVEGRVTVVQSRDEALAILKEIDQAAHGLNLRTNDPALAEMARSGAGIAGNVNIITGQAAALATHLVAPIVNKKPAKGFFGKLKRGLVHAYTVVNGAGTFFVIVNRLQ